MQAMCRDYYVLQFIDRSVDTAPIAPALAAFFDDVLDQSISQLNFKVSPHSWTDVENLSSVLALCYDTHGCTSRACKPSTLASLCKQQSQLPKNEQRQSETILQAIVDGLGAVLFNYPFRVPAYYALILRSLTVLEGLALSADRNYKLLAKAYPYIAKRLLTDPSPELR